MAVQELDKEQKELIENLADFRTKLEPLERQILDLVVHEACEPSGRAAAQPGDGAPSEAEVAQLVEKIQAFERTLPAEGRQLLDEILAAGSHELAEVEAHRTVLWRLEGGSGPLFWASYYVMCPTDLLSYTPYWWTGFTWGMYECWNW
jgi:hypothetical protein